MKAKVENMKENSNQNDLGQFFDGNNDQTFENDYYKKSNHVSEYNEVMNSNESPEAIGGFDRSAF